MTTLAWDGTTLAADRLIHHGGMRTAATKIEKTEGGCLLGFAGDYALSRELFEWFRRGRDPHAYPMFQQGPEGAPVDLLCIEPGGRVLIYSRSPYPQVIEEEDVALGSGREFARAALFMGATAKRAVEVAIALDVYSGIGIDVLTLKEPE